MKTVLLIIDMQNDFCKPTGNLYVPGAENDVNELSFFIQREAKNIDHIILTQDNHQVINIAHPSFWQDKEGNQPGAFTNITYKEVLEGKWIPKYQPDEAKAYIKKLEEQGEYMHTIWPEHCLMGSEGAAIVPAVMNQVADWARAGKYYDVVIKGTNPFTEHFGALRANIPVAGAPETQLNASLVKKLESFDRILIAGEAKSHCVANTIRQMFEFPTLVRKLVILNNCMSNVTNCELLAKPIYDKALTLCAKITDTHNFTF